MKSLIAGVLLIASAGTPATPSALATPLTGLEALQQFKIHLASCFGQLPGPSVMVTVK